MKFNLIIKYLIIYYILNFINLKDLFSHVIIKLS